MKRPCTRARNALRLITCTSIHVVWFRRSERGPAVATVPSERSLPTTRTHRSLTGRPSEGASHKYRQLFITQVTLAPGDDKIAPMHRLHVRVSVLNRSPCANENGATMLRLSPRCKSDALSGGLQSRWPTYIVPFATTASAL